MTDSTLFPEESFRARGIGLDMVPSCFVCGGTRAPVNGVYWPNIAAFVKSREAGERVVGFFGGRARLDYREFEPGWIQVKVGVCAKHRRSLDALMDITRDGKIDIRKIVAAFP